MGTDRRRAAIAREDVAYSQGPTHTRDSTPRSARPGWVETFFMRMVLGSGVIVLAGVSLRTTEPVHESASLDGSGTIVRSEPIHIWLPQTLIKRTNSPASASRVVRNHEEWRRFLEREGREDLWYAMTSRGHLVNGGFVDITMIRHPYDEPEHFAELRAILATAAGNPPHTTEVDFSRASVHLLSEEDVKRDPRQFMAEQLKD